MNPFKVPPHQIMDSHFDSESSWITVMCRASRFQISVSLKDLRGSSFEMEYSSLIKNYDDLDSGADEHHDALCNWIVEPCFSYFLESTLVLPENLTFEAFFSPPTHHLKLMISSASIYTKATRNRRTMNPFVLMSPSQDLPQDPQLRYSKAFDIRIASMNTEVYDYMSEIPSSATLSDGTIKFFKPAIEKSQIIREINMHYICMLRV